MTIIFTVFAACIGCVLIAFRLSLRRIRKQNPITKTCTAVAVLCRDCANLNDSVKDQMIQAEIGSVATTAKALEINSSDPPTQTEPALARHGASTFAAVFVLAAIGAAFVAGYSSRERSVIHHAETLKDLPVGSVELTRSGSPAHGQFDSKLAELRSKPTLAIVSWFESHVDKTRRDDVMPALESARQTGTKSVQFAALHAIKRWE